MSLILSGTDGLSDIDGSAATPAIRGTDANTGIFFPAADTIAFSEGGVESMRIDSAGNVGIGTASPTARLSVSGVTPLLTGGNGQLSVFSTDAIGADKGGKISFGGVSGQGGAFDPYGFCAIAGLKDNATASNYSGYLTFSTATSGGTVTERARIDSSGNLLVGTTSQLSSGKFCISFNGGSLQGQVLRTTLGTTGSTYIQFENSAGATAGYIIHNGTTTVNYVTSSDYRLKEAVAPMTGALAKVAQLKPVTYKWKVDGSDGEGFIAHELAEVCPIAVTREKDAVDADGNPQYQGIDTSFLVATLTAAIQEQQALITALTARITALETQNADNPSQGETP
jgi:hypothetical protein